MSTKILLKDYQFNIPYTVDWDEGHTQRFDNPLDAMNFCLSLQASLPHTIFHQVAAIINGKSEFVARQIDIRICEQMVNDKSILLQNNIQTAYKLALKVYSSAC